MTEFDPAQLPWLPDLIVQVQHALQQQLDTERTQRPALQQELSAINDNINGWTISLGNTKLPDTVRGTIESQLAIACERKQEIEVTLDELDHSDQRTKQLVQPAQVLERLDMLAEVLAKNNPTRGNLELSLHIDRITCFKDRRVEMRTCKLGTMTDAIELLVDTTATTDAKPDTVSVPAKAKARRRGRLRVHEGEDVHVDLRAVTNFAADLNRFAGLGEEWFWKTEFRVPDGSFSWAQENASAVFHRRQESKLPFSKLAAEFGVTPPTIGAAIRSYLADHPEAQDEVKLPRGGRRKPRIDITAFAAEARKLFDVGWSKERLAEKFGCSPPVIDKALSYAYAQDGLPPPTRVNQKHAKVSKARRLFDDGQSLDKIASALSVADVTARSYLRESFVAEGRPMPDLRTVRHEREDRRVG